MKHIENIQGQLLVEIFRRYSSRSGTSLNAFIKKKLKESDGDLDLTKNIKADLEELEQRDILTWKAEPMENKGGGFTDSQKYRDFLGTPTDPKYQTFKDIYVEVKLTPDKGLDHVAKYVEAQAAMSNNNWIKVLTVGILITAVFAAAIQYLQYRVSARQEERENKDLKDKNQFYQGRCCNSQTPYTKTLSDSVNSNVDTTTAKPK